MSRYGRRLLADEEDMRAGASLHCLTISVLVRPPVLFAFLVGVVCFCCLFSGAGVQQAHLVTRPLSLPTTLCQDLQ